MSTISNSDTSAYQTFQKQYDDYNADQSAEQKRAKQSEEERIAALERRQAENLRKQAEEYDRTINENRMSESEAAGRERENARKEVEALKKDGYDRFGRQVENDRRETKRLQEGFQRELDDRERRSADQSQDMDRHYLSLGESMAQKSHEDADQAMNKFRENFNDHHEKAIQQERENSLALASETEHRIGEMERNHQSELTDLRGQAQKALEAEHHDYNRRAEQARAAYERSAARVEQAGLDGKTDAASQLRASHENETRDLGKKSRTSSPKSATT